jgi:transcription elongation factor Elf1
LGKKSASIEAGVYEAMLEHLKDTRGRASGQIQRFVSEAITEKMSREKSDSSMVKFVKSGLVFDKIKYLQDKITKLTSFINFYGTYADGNEEKMLEAIGKTDEETKDLIHKVFETGKNSASMAKPLLKDMLSALAEIKSEMKKSTTKKPKMTLEELREKFRNAGKDKIRERFYYLKCDGCKSKFTLIKKGGDRITTICGKCGARARSYKWTELEVGNSGQHSA